MTHPSTPPNTRTAGTRSRDVLLNILILVLMPLFLAGADGDPGLARAAALETIAAYRAHSHASLLAVARSIAFGLAALDSLALSMRDDLPVALILRLRANANALNRSAERAEHTLAEAPCAAAEPQRPIDEAAIRAGVSEAQARAAAARAAMQAGEVASPSQPALNTTPAQLTPQPTDTPIAAPAQPAPQPTRAPIAASAQPASPPTRAPVASPVQPALAPMIAPAQQNNALWGAAMADVAAEFAAEAAKVPPAERRVATFRAQILSTTANNLLCGASVPLPRPGDLAALMQPPRR